MTDASFHDFALERDELNDAVSVALLNLFYQYKDPESAVIDIKARLAEYEAWVKEQTPKPSVPISQTTPPVKLKSDADWERAMRGIALERTSASAAETNEFLNKILATFRS